MRTEQLIFYTLCVAAAIAGTGILFIKEVLHAALLLIVCLLAIAGIFVFLQAEFLAVAQILIYAGGVLLLIIFGIMLSVRSTALNQDAGKQNFFAGSLVGLTVTAMLWAYLNQLNGARFHPGDSPISIAQIGIGLMTTYAAPFEIAGILLLVSMIGAINVATFLKKV